MPIYVYECECGARFEAIETIAGVRSRCGELCVKEPPDGGGAVQRLIGAAELRGTGHAAKEPTIDLRKRSGRWWDDCC